MKSNASKFFLDFKEKLFNFIVTEYFAIFNGLKKRLVVI